MLRANTNGAANGSAQWWVDGVLVGHHTNLNFVKANTGNAWTQIAWNPVWGGMGYVLDRDQDMQIDHMYVSGS